MVGRRKAADSRGEFFGSTHAYLAATRALLLHLQEMTGGDRAAVRALATKIERQMLDDYRMGRNPNESNECVALARLKILVPPPRHQICCLNL
jgi:hypothetical protein